MFNTIHEIIEDIKQGKIIILLDDEREHEGDMIVAAQFAIPENIHFMMKYGCGIICTPISKEIADILELGLQPRRNSNNLNQCMNTTSIDALHGLNGGVSAADRSTTIQTIAGNNVTKNDIKTPGHVFPLIANENGVLGRPGHTEAAIDLMKLAGLTPAAALVEVMNEDCDKIASNSELLIFAKKHNLKISTVKALIDYIKSFQL